MNEHDTILVRDLSETFRRQLVWYQELRDLVGKILSRLVLSRGDVSGVISGLEKKKVLLEAIESERNRNSGLIAQWQERKGSIEKNGSVQELEMVLEQTSGAICEFLDEEEQLKKYIESILQKDTDSTGQ